MWSPGSRFRRSHQIQVSPGIGYAWRAFPGGHPSPATGCIEPIRQDVATGAAAPPGAGLAPEDSARRRYSPGERVFAARPHNLSIHKSPRAWATSARAARPRVVPRSLFEPRPRPPHPGANQGPSQIVEVGYDPAFGQLQPLFDSNGTSPNSPKAVKYRGRWVRVKSRMPMVSFSFKVRRA